MKLSLKILENNQTIQTEILKALLSDCDKYMERAIGTIKQQLPSIVFSAISNRQEYTSLVTGKTKIRVWYPGCC